MSEEAREVGGSRGEARPGGARRPTRGRAPGGAPGASRRAPRTSGAGPVARILLPLAVLLGACAGGQAPAGDPPAAAAPPPGAEAPSADEAQTAVLGVVHGIFDAMRAKDVAYLEDVFHPEARLVTTGWRDGRPVVASVPAERFVRSVAMEEGELDEVIWGEEVRVRDNLATVWTEYSFYLDGVLHHCGVNAFQLARTPDGWKVVQISDTRREEGCEDRR